MRKGIWVGIIIVVLVLAGLFFLKINFKNTSSPLELNDSNNFSEPHYGGLPYVDYSNYFQGECVEDEGYCVYELTEEFFEELHYTNPEVEIPEEFLFEGEIEGSQVIVEYFYDLCEGFERMEGCDYSRKAIISGENIFVEEFRGDTGPVLYGPFDRLILDY